MMNRVRLITFVSLLLIFAAPAFPQAHQAGGARAVVRRMMAIRPRFPEGFGPAPTNMHPVMVRPKGHHLSTNKGTAAGSC